MYTIDYFIDMFSAIPTPLWNVGSLEKSNGSKCALGHCIDTNFDKYEAIGMIFRDVKVNIIIKNSCNDYGIGSTDLTMFAKVAAINNGETAEYQQETPKERILAALKDLKAIEDRAKYPDITTKLAILPVEETSDVKHEKVCS